MQSFIEKLKEGIFSQFEASPIQLSGINIIKHRKGIRKEVNECLENGKVLGIYCPALGEGMLLTGIDEILIGDKGEEVVVLSPYDMNGILIQRNHIAISEIKSVCPFDTYYINPITGKTKDEIKRQNKALSSL